jgi:hypothetical protein
LCYPVGLANRTQKVQCERRLRCLQGVPQLSTVPATRVQWCANLYHSKYGSGRWCLTESFWKIKRASRALSHFIRPDCRAHNHWAADTGDQRDPENSIDGAGDTAYEGFEEEALGGRRASAVTVRRNGILMIMNYVSKRR